MTEQEFNADFTPGQSVFLELDDGTMIDTYLRSQAWEIGSGDVIAKVDGKRGGWDISRIHHRDSDN